jgi:hypothetical protein
MASDNSILIDLVGIVDRLRFELGGIEWLMKDGECEAVGQSV